MSPLRALVTRPREQALELAEELRAHGFEPVLEPLIAAVPLSDDPIDVAGYDCVIVTSPNGARELARRMTKTPARLAAVGPGTAAALEEVGLAADAVAEVHTQEGLVATLGAQPGRSLFVGAEGARTHLVDELAADFVAAYRTVELGVTSLPEADIALLTSVVFVALGKLGLLSPQLAMAMLRYFLALNISLLFFNLLPVPPRDYLLRAWRLHFRDVRHSLESAFYHGWDLHPAQLVTRYVAAYEFFRECTESTAVGTVLEDPAARGVRVNLIQLGLDCGAIGEVEARAALS